MKKFSRKFFKNIDVPNKTFVKKITTNAGILDTLVESAEQYKSLIDAVANVTTTKINQFYEVIAENNGSIDDINPTSDDMMALNFARDVEQGLQNSEEFIKLIDVMLNNNPVINTTPTFITETNTASPEISSINLELTAGVVDKYASKIRFILTVDEIKENNVNAIRIFRSKLKTPKSVRKTRVRMSPIGINHIKQNVIRTTTKNSNIDQNQLVNRLVANNVDVVQTNVVARDPFTNTINTQVKDLLNNSQTKVYEANSYDDKNLSILSSYLKLNEVQNLDYSLVNNLNFIKNIQIKNPNIKLVTMAESTVGSIIQEQTTNKLKNQQIDNIQNTQIQEEEMVMVSNKIFDAFQELAIVPLSRLKATTIGNNLIEYEFFDKTIEFGNSYSYYITTLNDKILESTRSKIISINVEHSIPPQKPHAVTYALNNFITLSIKSNEKNIEKYEIYRSCLTKQENQTTTSIVVFGQSGHVIDVEAQTRLSNGFIKVGEALDCNDGGATFIDQTSIQGRKYLYRIYSVDIFGNKSQDSKELLVFFNERNFRSIDLEEPTLTVEIEQTTKKIKLIINNKDERIVSFFVARKNNTLHEKTFTIPSQPSSNKLGNNNIIANNRFMDGVVNSRESHWSGIISTQKGQSVYEFIDKMVRIDNIYQYSVYGIDRFGNKTSTIITKPIFVSRRTKINKPVQLQATFANSKVNISWVESNVDINPLAKIGNRSDYDDNSVKTLYQLERKDKGVSVWQKFPLTDQTSVIDEVLSLQPPQYRPPYLELGKEYLYRVIAFQSGGFISDYSQPVSVFVLNSVLPPINTIVKTAPEKQEPFWLAINWDTDPNSGIIDRWEIERVEINNFAAMKFNRSNKEINNLKYELYKTVYKESSRAMSTVKDQSVNQEDKLKTIASLVGQHYFIDRDVDFGNTYYYRITSIGIDNSRAEAVVVGMSVGDKVFGTKLDNVLSQKERDYLSNTQSPIFTKLNLRSNSRRLINKISTTESKKNKLIKKKFNK